MSTMILSHESGLPELLRELRRGLDPSTARLGAHERLRSRRGRMVSQEELAEAIGVSRGWYACFETGAKRPSVALIARLAHALNMTPRDVAAFLELAIPGLENCLSAAVRCPNCCEGAA